MMLKKTLLPGCGLAGLAGLATIAIVALASASESPPAPPAPDGRAVAQQRYAAFATGSREVSPGLADTVERGWARELDPQSARSALKSPSLNIDVAAGPELICMFVREPGRRRSRGVSCEESGSDRRSPLVQVTLEDDRSYSLAALVPRDVSALRFELENGKIETPVTAASGATLATSSKPVAMTFVRDGVRSREPVLSP